MAVKNKEYYLRVAAQAKAKEYALLAKAAKIDEALAMLPPDEPPDTVIPFETKSDLAIKVRHELEAAHPMWSNESIIREMMDITDKTWAALGRH
ncbi:MAG: hypothetical protein Q7N50_09985 [Armatimonadota bacterium]|nr:hypothetical protein [Armatimonadota bacterium]